MFSLLNKYRFTADVGGTDTNLTPVNDGLRKRFELQDDGVSYRLTMQTELLFKGADYTYFQGVLESDECEVTLLIEEFCAGDWVTWFDGRVVPSEGKWNFDRCEVALKVLPNDPYECAKKQFGVERNWLSAGFGTPKTLKALYGTIETIVCSYDGLVVIPNVQLLFLRDCFSGDGPHDVQFDPDPDPTTAWTPVNHIQVFTGSGTPGVDDVSIDTTWKRERATQPTQPPGYGWISIGVNEWARPISTLNATQEQTSNTYTYDADIADFEEVSNGRLLSDMLEAAVSATGCVETVVSNFLNINPDATAPTNAAYDFAQDDEGVFVSPLIFQKSDIVNADATNDATYLPLTLTDMLVSLRDSLNVHWAIVDVSGTITLRLEHWSYFEGSAGLDLTTLGGGKYIRGRNSYETDGDIPAFERFSYQENIIVNFMGGFLPSQIDYGCATTSEKDYQLTQMNADFAALYGNTAAGLKGFVFICAYNITGDEYLIDNLGGVANGAMQWKYLLDNLWIFGRYSFAASRGGADFPVETVRARKAQAQINVSPFCCQTFEPSETVTTQLGAGRVKTAEIDTKTGLTLNLMHQ